MNIDPWRVGTPAGRHVATTFTEFYSLFAPKKILDSTFLSHVEQDGFFKALNK